MAELHSGDSPNRARDTCDLVGITTTKRRSLECEEEIRKKRKDQTSGSPLTLNYHAPQIATELTCKANLLTTNCSDQVLTSNAEAAGGYLPGDAARETSTSTTNSNKLVFPTAVGNRPEDGDGIATAANQCKDECQNAAPGTIFQFQDGGDVEARAHSRLLKGSESESDVDNEMSGMSSHDDNDTSFSGDSSLSDDESGSLSGGESAWAPAAAGSLTWVHRQMRLGANPRDILKELLPAYEKMIPAVVPDVTLWRVIASAVCNIPCRAKLEHINHIDDVVGLLRSCSKVVVLTGAGVSVSCGIPDFRSRDGLYARVAVDYPDLPDPQAIFDIEYFKQNPRPFFQFAKEIYPGKFVPSPSHHFIKLIEENGKLLRNYTQNIDTLEHTAGIQNVVECHGSFATASCMVCKHKVGGEMIKDDINNQVIPHCCACPSENASAIMKPDIVFFGENLPASFHAQMAEDKDACDLLIVMGSSLKVRPVSLIPSSLPPSVPQVLINREPLPHQQFDVELLGDCDAIVSELCIRLSSPVWCRPRDSAATYESRLPMRQVLYEELVNCIGSESEAAMQLKRLSSHCNSACDAASPGPSHSPVSNAAEAAREPQVLEASTGIHTDIHHLCQACPQCGRHPQHYAHNDDSCVQLERASSSQCIDSTAYKNDGAKTVQDGPVPCSCQAALKVSTPSTEMQARPMSKRLITEMLADHTFLFLPPSRHIFHGAELSLDEDLDSQDGDSSDSKSERSTHDGVRTDSADIKTSDCRGDTDEPGCSAENGDDCSSLPGATVLTSQQQRGTGADCSCGDNDAASLCSLR